MTLHCLIPSSLPLPLPLPLPPSPCLPLPSTSSSAFADVFRRRIGAGSHRAAPCANRHTTSARRTADQPGVEVLPLQSHVGCLQTPGSMRGRIRHYCLLGALAVVSPSAHVPALLLLHPFLFPHWFFCQRGLLRAVKSRALVFNSHVARHMTLSAASTLPVPQPPGVSPRPTCAVCTLPRCTPSNFKGALRRGPCRTPCARCAASAAVIPHQSRCRTVTVLLAASALPSPSAPLRSFHPGVGGRGQ